MTDYDKARAEHDAAFRAFEPIRTAYTDINIPMNERPTTDEYMKARAIYEEATRQFDVAFEKAQNR